MIENEKSREEEGVLWKRQEKHRLKCCLATKHPQDCTVMALLLLYSAFLGHSSLFYGNNSRGEAPKVSVEMQGGNNSQAVASSFSHGLREQLSRTADTTGHIFPDFILFCQELQQNPSYQGKMAFTAKTCFGVP